jgi:hypothetical protein
MINPVIPVIPKYYPNTTLPINLLLLFNIKNNIVSLMDIVCKAGKHFSDTEVLKECAKNCERCSKIDTHKTETAKKPKIDVFSNVIWPKG